MEYSNFFDTVCKEVQELLGDSYSVKKESVLKNNSQRLDSIVVTSGDDEVAPSIYIQKYYDQYLQGDSINSISNELVDFYTRHKVGKNNVVPQIYNISDYEKIKDRIIVKMINKGMNEELLRNCPNIEYLDFALTFHYILDMDDSTNASVRISNELFEHWKIDFKTLSEQALDNTVRLCPVKVGLLSEMLNKLSVEFLSELEDVRDCLPQMFVVTNTCGSYGATCILYNGLLEGIAKSLDSDLVLLPSSVHEMLIFPLNDEKELEKYLVMVEEVNDTELDVTDLLSYNVYVYRKDEKKIMIYPADFMPIR